MSVKGYGGGARELNGQNMLSGTKSSLLWPRAQSSLDNVKNHNNIITLTIYCVLKSIISHIPQKVR